MTYDRKAYDEKYFTKQFEAEHAKGSKVCNKCSQELPLDAFHNNNKWGAKRPDCKACSNAHRKALRKADPRHRLVQHAKKRARDKGIEFAITVEDVTIPDTCPLIGISVFVNDDKIGDNSPSLDRIDNSKGYIPGNVMVVSYKANRMKSNATLEELKLLVENLSNLL